MQFLVNKDIFYNISRIFIQSFRYVFFFQLPMLPIYFLLLNDLDFVESVFTSKVYGAKQGTFTEEDIECFKYNFADYGEL